MCSGPQNLDLHRHAGGQLAGRRRAQRTARVTLRIDGNGTRDDRRLDWFATAGIDDAGGRVGWRCASACRQARLPRSSRRDGSMTRSTGSPGPGSTRSPGLCERLATTPSNCARTTVRPASALAAPLALCACSSAALASRSSRSASSTSFRAATPRSNNPCTRAEAALAFSTRACACSIAARLEVAPAVSEGISKRTSRSPVRTRRLPPSAVRRYARFGSGHDQFSPRGGGYQSGCRDHFANRTASGFFHLHRDWGFGLCLFGCGVPAGRQEAQGGDRGDRKRCFIESILRAHARDPRWRTDTRGLRRLRAAAPRARPAGPAETPTTRSARNDRNPRPSTRRPPPAERFRRDTKISLPCSPCARRVSRRLSGQLGDARFTLGAQLRDTRRLDSNVSGVAVENGTVTATPAFHPYVNSGGESKSTPPDTVVSGVRRVSARRSRATASSISRSIEAMSGLAATAAARSTGSVPPSNASVAPPARQEAGQSTCSTRARRVQPAAGRFLLVVGLCQRKFRLQRFEARRRTRLKSIARRIPGTARQTRAARS